MYVGTNNRCCMWHSIVMAKIGEHGDATEDFSTVGGEDMGRKANVREQSSNEVFPWIAIQLDTTFLTSRL